MTDESARGAEAARGARPLPRAGREERRRPAKARSRRGQVFDRRLAAIAAGVTVALLAAARYFLDGMGPTGWSWQLLMLCVLVAAAAGRGLLGLRESSEEQERRPSRRFRAAIWLVLLGAATLPNLHGLHVGFLADDFGLLRAARLAAGPFDVARLLPLRIFYRPVSLLVWWTGLHLWNGSPLGYQLSSLALHAANTSLLYVLARRYIGSVYGGAMAALLFAVHPVHVETTVWASAQPDLLCTAFCLSSMWCVEQYVTSRRGYREHLALVGALATFLLALWSKETAIALPGIVLLRVAFTPREGRRARAAWVGGTYALGVGLYLAVRLFMLREHWLGGEGTRLAFWNAVYPSMPLLLTGELFFPTHRALFESVLPGYLWVAVTTVMALGLLWCVRSLESVSWQRLALYTSYVFLPAIPLSTAGLTIGVNMENSRYAYLPSVGLALLFGEICARSRGGRGRTGLIGVATIVAAAVLSVWYVAPWRQAARLRDDLLGSAVGVVATLPDSPPPSTVLFEGVPFSHLGAALFVEGCFWKALAPLVDRPVSIEEVAPDRTALELMSESDLLPGEYLVSWDDESRTMVIERAGGQPAPQPAREVPP